MSVWKKNKKLFCSSTAHQPSVSSQGALAADAQLVQPDCVIVDLLTRDLAKHQATITETALRTVTFNTNMNSWSTCWAHKYLIHTRETLYMFVFFLYVIIWTCDCIYMRCKTNCKDVNSVKQGCILKDCIPNCQVCTKACEDSMTAEPFPCFQHWGSALWAHYHTNNFTVWCNVLFSTAKTWEFGFIPVTSACIWEHKTSQIIASQFDMVSHLTLQTTEKFRTSWFVRGKFHWSTTMFTLQLQHVEKGGMKSQINAQKQIVICWMLKKTKQKKNASPNRYALHQRVKKK